jgi:hypothetical protein
MAARAFPKLTKERTERLVSLLRAGQNRESACAAVGIGTATLRRWLAGAEQGDKRLLRFARLVHEAESDAETRAVAQVQLHGKSDWRALAWWLERRYPKKWGDHKVVTMRVEEEREQMLDVLQRILQQRGLDDVLEEVLRELADGGEAPTDGAPIGEATTRH